jgi:hypothetical protein
VRIARREGKANLLCALRNSRTPPRTGSLPRTGPALAAQYAPATPCTANLLSSSRSVGEGRRVSKGQKEAIGEATVYGLIPSERDTIPNCLPAETPNKARTRGRPRTAVEMKRRKASARKARWRKKRKQQLRLSSPASGSISGRRHLAHSERLRLDGAPGTPHIDAFPF